MVLGSHVFVEAVELGSSREVGYTPFWFFVEAVAAGSSREIGYLKHDIRYFSCISPFKEIQNEHERTIHPRNLKRLTLF